MAKARRTKVVPREMPARRVVYSVAMSLDGYIAGPNGEYDWIVSDPAMDFGAMFARFDTLLIGRKTFEMMAGQGGGKMPGINESIVFSKTLDPKAHKKIRIESRDLREVLDELRQKDGKDFWLFGGGGLFASMLSEGLVDEIQVALIPVVLGSGIPFVQPTLQTKLRLARHTVYDAGVVLLGYEVA